MDVNFYRVGHGVYSARYQRGCRDNRGGAVRFLSADGMAGHDTEQAVSRRRAVVKRKVDVTGEPVSRKNERTDI